MASGREIVLVGGGAAAVILCDDTSMNGSNGLAFPIVVEPGDEEGPTTEMPKHALYIYTAPFHWTVTMGEEDQPARAIMETLAHEQFKFGTQAKKCHRCITTGQMETERRVIELESRAATL